MPTDPLEAVAWLNAHVAEVDRKTKLTRYQHDSSTDGAEREALGRELMLGLWMRGAANERAAELLLHLTPERAEELRPMIEQARSEQAIGRQSLWGDPSSQ